MYTATQLKRNSSLYRDPQQISQPRFTFYSGTGETFSKFDFSFALQMSNMFSNVQDTCTEESELETFNTKLNEDHLLKGGPQPASVYPGALF